VLHIVTDALQLRDLVRAFGAVGGPGAFRARSPDP